MVDVCLSQVRKSFGGVDVIRHLDLEIKHGEFVVFVGPSGCGKSTLLRLISGLEDITSGELRIDGQLMNGVDPAQRGIAMVFQSYALYPHMTVRENMGFALRRAGMPKAEVAAKVDAAGKMLGLLPLMERKPKDLSGGQRQRVAIGRAIVRDPKVFLFDEPLSNLDAELRSQMRVELARLQRELDATVIYVTHDQVEAMTLADKIVVLRGGQVEQAGSPLVLYEKPANTFVAGFIGTPKMNLLAGRVTAVEQNQAGYRCTIELTQCGSSTIAMQVPRDPPTVGGEVSIGVRSEHFVDAGDAQLHLTVEVIENLGRESHVHARSESGAAIVLCVDTGHGLVRGQSMIAHFDTAKAHLFDNAGKRLGSDQ